MTKLYKIWRTYSRVYSEHNCSCISNEAVYLRRFILMTSYRTETETVSRMDHSIVVAAISQWCRRLSACVTAHSGHFEHILWCFRGSVCINLMLRIFEFGVLLFDCFVCRQNVTCLKRFTRYGHYAGEMEDVITVPKIRAFSCGLMTVYKEVVGFVSWTRAYEVMTVDGHIMPPLLHGV